MNLGTIELYENILWFVLLPITIIFCIVIMFFKISKKEVKNIISINIYIIYLILYIFFMFIFL